jgi:benzylsuccinate CoA-transferase BbsF subunit
MACIAEAFIESGVDGQSVEARGNEHLIGSPHGVFPCAGEDRWIAITVEADEHWENLKSVVGEPFWAEERFDTVEGRLNERDIIEAQLSAWTALKPAVVLMRTLQTAGVPAGVAYTATQVMADVHFTEREFFQTVEHPVLGALRMEGHSFKARKMQLSDVVRAPLFGEHTRDVFTEWLGMGDGEYSDLERSGALS